MEASQQEGQEPQDEGVDPAARTEEPEAEPTQGDQGPQVIEQDAADASPGATGRFDPNAPSRISPPSPEQQSGVPGIPENEGVQPGGDDVSQSVKQEAEGGTGQDEGDE